MRDRDLISKDSEDGGPLLHPDHARPVTRRQFLGQGFLTGAAWVTLPSLAQLLDPRVAEAQLSCGLGGGGKIPYIGIDLAGGASIAGSNVLVGLQGGQLDVLSDDAYVKFGLPTDQFPQLPNMVNTELGIAFHADSALLRGIIDKTSLAARALVNGTVFCARSDNDTGNNPHNPIYGINKAGADGNLVTLIGTRSSDSGGKSAVPMSMFDASVRPTKVDRPSDVTGLVDAGRLSQMLGQGGTASVMAASEQISNLKIDALGANTDTPTRTQLRCGYLESTNLISTFGDPNALDPEQDPEITGLVTSIFDANEIGESEFRKIASAMKLVVNGNAGGATCEFGGYDYHNSTRSTGENKDFRAGQAIGAAIEYAHRLGRPLMLYIFSDGSVSSNGQLDNSTDGRGKGIWRSDNSGTASTLILVYNPVVRPVMRTAASHQIGYFRDSGSVETSATVVADEPALLAEAIVLNYMALHNEEANFGSVLPGHSLGSGAALDSLIAFAPIL